MSRLRGNTYESTNSSGSGSSSATAANPTYSSSQNYTGPITRVIASGTLFLIHTIRVPSFPYESAVVRAQSVTRRRGGSAPNILSCLAQFDGLESNLVAPLGGGDEGKTVVRELESGGVRTRFCQVWDGAGVPGAWVFQSKANGSRTVVQHNPLPDLTHEEFVSNLGPLLVPENYSVSPGPQNPPHLQTVYPAPFEWLHFEGRSVKTTLNNLQGIDGLARDRGWRDKVVFSLEVGKKGRQGVEALIPHVDVIFFSKAYAMSHGYTSPRPFLLSMTPLAPPHSILIVNWGLGAQGGAAILSIPTKEYFQSSGWIDPGIPSSDPGSPIEQNLAGVGTLVGRRSPVSSVHSGSNFWADGHRSSSSAQTHGSGGMGAGYDSGWDMYTVDGVPPPASGHLNGAGAGGAGGGDAEDDDGGEDDPMMSGTHDAFMAGMIYALTRGLLPGSPWTSAQASPNPNTTGRGKGVMEGERSKWRLEECLRFATELSGRKARRKGFGGLKDEMKSVGWSI
ncbi:hypothetical protein SISSUDRAFT_987164 [Sistotremastrum suecicum HHB10207 ss-3]|uniref:Carbohydrate kinase PfkB domain-containing protein n=1 Tax=Sistotremastrum suecicum HHB10207 ss-3 TaxID=1314776 RepID=A0A166CTW6_9AGAM|nr:hypothetical protein SISSUDRAFT_987164 [Sistotremastrum suecicum HHB10207 ss-3]